MEMIVLNLCALSQCCVVSGLGGCVEKEVAGAVEDEVPKGESEWIEC